MVFGIITTLPITYVNLSYEIKKSSKLPFSVLKLVINSESKIFLLKLFNEDAFVNRRFITNRTWIKNYSSKFIKYDSSSVMIFSLIGLYIIS